MGSFILSRDERGLITTRCVWCREPHPEWLDRRIELWQRQHECDPVRVRTPSPLAGSAQNVAQTPARTIARPHRENA